jgi:hypothetical protein
LDKSFNQAKSTLEKIAEDAKNIGLPTYTGTNPYLTKASTELATLLETSQKMTEVLLPPLDKSANNPDAPATDEDIAAIRE